MRLRLVAGCDFKDCPRIYLSDRGTVVFQGDSLTQAESLRLGPGEQAVELPVDVVRSALPALVEE